MPPERAAAPSRPTKGMRTRQRLLDEAVNAFAAAGYRDGTVSGICAAAGLSTTAAYAYFPGKDDLWRAAIAADLDRLRSRVRQTPLDAARPFASAQLALVSALEHHPLTRRVLTEGTPDDLRLARDHPLFAETTRLIAGGLHQRQVDGTLAADRDPDLLALGVETISFSLLLTTLRAGLTGSPDRVAGVLAVIHAALGGPPEQSRPATDPHPDRPRPV